MIDDLIELVLDMFFGSIFIIFFSIVFFLLGEGIEFIIFGIFGILLFIISIILGICILEERRKKWK